MNATSTAFHLLEYPTDMVLLVILWRLRDTLSLRDVAEMFLVRGFVFTHEAVRGWEARFAPFLADQLRTKRRGKAGTSWDVEAHLRKSVRKMVVSLSSDRPGWQFGGFAVRARNGRGMQHSDLRKQAVDVVGHTPKQVTTDELRNSLRPRHTIGEPVSLSEQRRAFRKPLDNVATADANHFLAPSGMEWHSMCPDKLFYFLSSDKTLM